MVLAEVHVFRRVGGLEGSAHRLRRPAAVFRRVGGLEVCDTHADSSDSVFRRVGGLEVGRAGSCE